jgi:hypothetical protein
MSKPPSSLSKLEFFSFLVYPTRGGTSKAADARIIVGKVKDDKMHKSGEETWGQRAVRRLRETNPEGIEDFLGQERVLVPVPRSSLQKPGSHWPARRIGQYLVEAGFGSGPEELLRRAKPIRSSSLSQSGGGRATMQEKYDSLEARATLNPPGLITIVDDVITKGSEVFAAARRLREAFLNAEIRAFGMALTRGQVTDVPSIFQPFRGWIRLNAWGGVDRDDPPATEEGTP